MLPPFLRPAILLFVSIFLAACMPVSETRAAAAATSVADGCPTAQARAAALEARAAVEAKAIAAATASRGPGDPALWTMSDNDSTIHILGTVHLLRPGLDWRSAEIDAAIAAADRVVFEADTESPEAARELMRFFTTKGTYADGTRLTSLLTPEEKAELAKAVTLVNLPIEAIEPMRPWFAAINLAVIQMQAAGFDPAAGVETVIGAEAASNGASFAYLETVDQQLGEFAALPDCLQVDFLMMTAQSMEQGIDLLDMLVAEWADGDVRGLGLLMANREVFGSDPVYDAMLRNRNERWVPQIVALLETPGTTLVAVGAGHLAGPDSVIALLRTKGYEVRGP